MFASCGWFWDEPARIETAGALRAAVRAARLMDGVAGTDLERRLVADLHLVAADGIGILDTALAAVGAPVAGATDPSLSLRIRQPAACAPRAEDEEENRCR
jgi:hypothetical protein